MGNSRGKQDSQGEDDKRKDVLHVENYRKSEESNGLSQIRKDTAVFEDRVEIQAAKHVSRTVHQISLPVEFFLHSSISKTQSSDGTSQ
jgi:hypothetical protein